MTWDRGPGGIKWIRVTGAGGQGEGGEAGRCPCPVPGLTPTEACWGWGWGSPMESALTAVPGGGVFRRICAKNSIAGSWVENLTQLEITSFRNYWKRNLIK